MTATTSDNAASVVMLELKDAHLCGSLECRTISNVHGECPRCTSQTTTVANMLENEANALAHRIALDAAKIDIVSYCTPVYRHAMRWFNLDAIFPIIDKAHVMRSAMYLGKRGSLIHNSTNPALVRWE